MQYSTRRASNRKAEDTRNKDLQCISSTKSLSRPMPLSVNAIDWFYILHRDMHKLEFDRSCYFAKPIGPHGYKYALLPRLGGINPPRPSVPRTSTLDSDDNKTTPTGKSLSCLPTPLARGLA